jgi:hypothetical protein
MVNEMNGYVYMLDFYKSIILKPGNESHLRPLFLFDERERRRRRKR